MFNYNNNPYMNTYGSYYQQPYGATPTQSQSNNYQPQNQQTQIGSTISNQPTYMPLTFVNNIEEVNKFIVSPNTSVYLRSNSDNLLYIKSCDSTGKYNLETYELVKANETTKNQVATKPKEESKEFIGIEELKGLEERLEHKISKLQGRIDKLSAKKEEK